MVLGSVVSDVVADSDDDVAFGNRAVRLFPNDYAPRLPVVRSAYGSVGVVVARGVSGPDEDLAGFGVSSGRAERLCPGWGLTTSERAGVRFAWTEVDKLSAGPESPAEGRFGVQQGYPKGVAFSADGAAAPVHFYAAVDKTWAPGVYHGLRRQHLQSCLDEFVFRFNRRRSRHAAFPSILRIGLEIKPATYKMLIEPELKG